MSEQLAIVKQTLDRILLDPTYHDLLAIVKGARAGLVYGVSKSRCSLDGLPPLIK